MEGSIVIKKWIMTVLVILLLVNLCACYTVEPPETSSTKVEISNPSESSTIKENGTVGEDSETSSRQSTITHTTVTETWDSEVEVNADVLAVDTRELATYTGSLRVFTAEEVAEVLGLSLENAVDSQIVASSPEGLIEGEYAYYQFENGSDLICNAARVTYSTETSLKINDLLIIHGNDANGNFFPTGEALPFASIEEARDEVQSTIDQLGIAVIDEPSCYTLSYELLKQENDRQYETAKDMADGLGEDMAPSKLDINEDDACYVFVYPVSVKGFPVSPYLNGVYGDGSLTPGTELVVCYDKNGIAGLSFEYIPEVSSSTSAETALSLEEIMEKEKEKYASLILDGEYYIYEIRQEYIAQPNASQENSYTFLPVWRFSIEHTFEIDKGDGTGSTLQATETVFDIYNAVTGEEIPYDIG